MSGRSIDCLKNECGGGISSIGMVHKEDCSLQDLKTNMKVELQAKFAGQQRCAFVSIHFAFSSSFSFLFSNSERFSVVNETTMRKEDEDRLSRQKAGRNSS